MKVKFCGASRTVTGSCHLITLDSGFRILLDCGLYQGRQAEFEEFNNQWLFDPAEVNVLILSHAHIDHCGRIPKLVKDGFNGDIICTSATRDLASILLSDSAMIQLKEYNYADENEKEEFEPLYDLKDVRRSINQFIGIGYDRWYKINDEVEILLKDAGHILGSASVTLKIKSEDGERLIGFTGDIGRPDRPILNDPQPMPQVEALISESTYGNRLHKSAPEDKSSLLKVILKTCVEQNGKLIIPAFSVGRTQEILYMLDQLETAGDLPNVKVYIDSPLAIKATEIFRMHPECYDDQLTEYLMTDPNPFGFENLRTTRTKSESKLIKDDGEPAIIISASGMMQAGRIRHHIWQYIDNPRNTLLVVGYCAPRTTGAYLRCKPDKIRMFGKWKKVEAAIEIMDSFSGHGDNAEMRHFLRTQSNDTKLFLVHGDYDTQKEFEKDLNKDGFNDVTIPKIGDEVIL